MQQEDLTLRLWKRILIGIPGLFYFSLSFLSFLFVFIKILAEGRHAPFKIVIFFSLYALYCCAISALFLYSAFTGIIPPISYYRKKIWNHIVQKK